jgi:hypothetical protein
MGGAYILVFIGRKLGTLLQTDANEAEIKKKFNIFYSAPS